MQYNSHRRSSSLSRHMKKAHPEVPSFQCGFQGCELLFHTSKDKQTHYRTNHAKVNQATWPCPIVGCQTVLKRKDMMLKHLEKIHPEHGHLECPVRGCVELFRSNRDRDAHVNDTHAEAIIPCRLNAKGCNAQFLNHTTEHTHYCTVHCNREICCLAQGCEETFSNPVLRHHHMRTHHAGVDLYPCPELGCDRAFNKLREMHLHFEEEHSPKPIFHCTYDGCEEQFLAQRALNLHQRKDHLKLEFKCPEEECPKILTSQGGLEAHIQAIHECRNYLCHWPSCDATYTSRSGLRSHLRAVHNPIKLQCSYPDCSSVYTSQASLMDHVRQKHRNWISMESPCPLADQEDCRESFPSPSLAALHANAVHWGQFPCSNHEQSDCKALFLDKNSADLHARGHLRFICSVACCKDAVMGRARDRSSFRKHTQQHRKSKQFCTLINIPEPTEIVVTARPADEHDEDESDPVLDDDNIDDFEDDNNSCSEGFNHGVSAMFPLARVIAAVETVEEQRCYLLSRNQKLLTCEYGHHDLQCIL